MVLKAHPCTFLQTGRFRGTYNELSMLIGCILLSDWYPEYVTAGFNLFYNHYVIFRHFYTNVPASYSIKWLFSHQVLRKIERFYNKRNKNLESQYSGKKNMQFMLLSPLSMFHVHKKISIDKCIIWVWVLLATERVISNNPVPYCIWSKFGFLGFP